MTARITNVTVSAELDEAGDVAALIANAGDLYNGLDLANVGVYPTNDGRFTATVTLAPAPSEG